MLVLSVGSGKGFVGDGEGDGDALMMSMLLRHHKLLVKKYNLFLFFWDVCWCADNDVGHLAMTVEEANREYAITHKISTD